MEEEAKVCADFTIFNLNIIDEAKAATALHARRTYFVLVLAHTHRMRNDDPVDCTLVSESV